MSDRQPIHRAYSSVTTLRPGGPAAHPAAGPGRSVTAGLVDEITTFLTTQPSRTVPDRDGTGDGGPPQRCILLPYGDSTVATYAVQAVIEFAPAFGARVHVLDARPWEDPRAGPPIGGTITAAIALTDEAVADLRAHGVTARGAVRRAGPTGIACQILDEAMQIRAAAIMLACRARRALWAMVCGSISLPVIRQAPCPVVLVHPPARPQRRTAHRHTP